MEFHLPEYDFDEFGEIVVRLAADRYRLNREIAHKIAYTVWHDMGTKDVRDALQLMKLASSIDEVVTTAKTIIKYKHSKSNTGHILHKSDIINEDPSTQGWR
jgi:hypothetical protein